MGSVTTAASWVTRRPSASRRSERRRTVTDLKCRSETLRSRRAWLQSEWRGEWILERVPTCPVSARGSVIFGSWALLSRSTLPTGQRLTRSELVQLRSSLVTALVYRCPTCCTFLRRTATCYRSQSWHRRCSGGVHEPGVRLSLWQRYRDECQQGWQHLQV